MQSRRKPGSATRPGSEGGWRRPVRLALVVLGTAALVAATVRVITTRDPAQPEVNLVVTPVRGPVGTHPFAELRGWSPDEQVQVSFCVTSDDERCAQLGSGPGRERLRLEAVPAALPAPGGGSEPVGPGSYEIVARGAGRTERLGFDVVGFEIGRPPRAHDHSDTDPQKLVAGDPIEVAEGAGCLPVVVPDGRLLVSRTLFDPSTAVTYDFSVAGHELAWSPDGERLAIVTVDRKEIRLAGPDGSEPQAVVREARGLLSSVTWAADGDRIAFVTRSDPGVRGGPARPTLSVFNLVDGSRTDLGPAETVSWAPHTDELAVEVAESGTRSILRVKLDGTRSSLAQGRRPSWSPDGSLIVFVRASDQTGEGWIMASDGSSQHRLLEGPDICGISFTAEGRRLAVSSHSGDTFALTVRPLRDSTRPAA